MDIMEEVNTEKMAAGIIAYPMFVVPIAHSSFWVMFTYYAAQALLTCGILKMKPQR